MSWKEKLAFGEPTFVVSKVGENAETKFYPVSVGLMFKLRSIGKPLASAIAVLTSSGNKDTGNIYREIGEPVLDAEGKILYLKDNQGSARPIRDSETICEAIDPKLAELRTKQRVDAIDTLVSAAMDQSNLNIIAEIIMDSLRLGKDAPPAKEFVDSIPLPILTEMVIGVCKANKGVFGPFSKKMAPLFTRAQRSIEDRIGKETGDGPSVILSPKQNGETSPTL